MPMSNYLKHIRAKVGQEVLLLPSVTAITFDEAGRILLVKHSNGEVWVAPGGSIEPNETPASAVVREMWEETGLWVTPTCLIGMYSGPEFEVTYANGDPVIYVMSVFECQIIGGHLSPDHMETLEIGFFVEHGWPGCHYRRGRASCCPMPFGTPNGRCSRPQPGSHRVRDDSDATGPMQIRTAAAANHPRDNPLERCADAVSRLACCLSPWKGFVRRPIANYSEAMSCKCRVAIRFGSTAISIRVGLIGSRA